MSWPWIPPQAAVPAPVMAVVDRLSELWTGRADVLSADQALEAVQVELQRTRNLLADQEDKTERARHFAVSLEQELAAWRAWGADVLRLAEGEREYWLLPPIPADGFHPGPVTAPEAPGVAA